jgi:hypothetical protein
VALIDRLSGYAAPDVPKIPIWGMIASLDDLAGDKDLFADESEVCNSWGIPAGGSGERVDFGRLVVAHAADRIRVIALLCLMEATDRHSTTRTPKAGPTLVARKLGLRPPDHPDLQSRGR